MPEPRHLHKRRRSGRGPVASTLWSCWCSCGAVCPDLTKDPHAWFAKHLDEVETAEMDALMRRRSAVRPDA